MFDKNKKDNSKKNQSYVYDIPFPVVVSYDWKAVSVTTQESVDALFKDMSKFADWTKELPSCDCYSKVLSGYYSTFKNVDSSNFYEDFLRDLGVFYGYHLTSSSDPIKVTYPIFGVTEPGHFKDDCLLARS